MDYSYSTTNDGARNDDEYPFRSIDLLSRWVLSLLGVGAVTLVLNEIASFMQLSTDDLEAAQLRADMAIIGYGLALLATIPVFAVWIVRAHRNLPALGAERLDVRPGWAVGWFFIPIANLWKPYTSMRTLWKASHSGPRWEYEDMPWWVTAWWLGWILSGMLDRVVGAIPEGRGEEAARWATEVSMVTDGVSLVVQGLAAMLVYRIWQAQNAQRAAREVAAESPPPPSLRDALPSTSHPMS
jgi:hypothetical protein